jgi:oligopeptide transport system permease protein
MGRYLARRLLQLIPVFFGTTFLIYFLVWSLPGDPFAGKCGERPCPPAFVEAMKARFHLGDPLPLQYLHYLQQLVHGNFGETFSGIPVADQLAQTYPITLRLALIALASEAIIGIAAGVLTGLRRGGFFDNLVLLSTLVIIATPIFVIGYVAQFALIGLGLPAFPPTWHSDNMLSMLVPGLVLGSGSLAYVARLTRASIAENRRSDFVRTAVSKGLTNRRVVGIHLLRNSLISVVTFLGTDLGALMGGAIITEGIFNINGVGGLVYRGIRTREATTVVGVVTVLVLVYLLMNLLVDLLYAVLDPRIRYE